MEDITVFVAVFIIDMLLLPEFVTYAYAPDGANPMSKGPSNPEFIAFTTVLVAVLIISTLSGPFVPQLVKPFNSLLPLLQFTMYAYVPDGANVTPYSILPYEVVLPVEYAYIELSVTNTQ